MINALFLLKIIFVIIGIALILTGFYLTIKVYPSYNYSYISEKERRKRSSKAGLSAIIIVIGFLLIATTIASQEITLNTLLLILEIVLCFSPLIAGLAFGQVYRYLRAFTKGEDDVVFMDQNDKNK